MAFTAQALLGDAVSIQIRCHFGRSVTGVNDGTRTPPTDIAHTKYVNRFEDNRSIFTIIYGITEVVVSVATQPTAQNIQGFCK